MEGRESNHLVLKGKELQRLPDDISISSQLLKVDVSQNLLTDLKGLEGFGKLTWLKASHNQLNSVKHVKKLTTLNVLNLGYNKLTSTANLLKLKELRALILNDNLLEEVNLNNLNLLNTLVISHNQLASIDVSTFPSLQKFSASHNKFSSVPNLQRQKDIKEIRLNDNQISDIPGWIGQCKKLKLVDLGNNQIKDMTSIKLLAKLPFLENLNLKGNPVCDTEDFYIKMKALFPSLVICNGKKLSDLYFASLTAKESTQKASPSLTGDKKTGIPEIKVKSKDAEKSSSKTEKKRGFKSTMTPEISDSIEPACKKTKEVCQQEGSELNAVEEKKKKKKKKQKENEDISSEKLSNSTAFAPKTELEEDATQTESAVDVISDTKLELVMNEKEEIKSKKKKKKKHKTEKPMKKVKQHSGVVAITNVPKKRKNSLPVTDMFSGGENFGTGIGVGW